MTFTFWKLSNLSNWFHVNNSWSINTEPFLQECATLGSGLPICRQAQTKLEVCLYMFLWSPDAEAVLVAMSCFRHLCEEADIRSAADEVPVQTILPNYSTFSELASVSNMMGTGKWDAWGYSKLASRNPLNNIKNIIKYNIIKYNLARLLREEMTI